MKAKHENSASNWIDDDDAPILDDSFFENGTWRVGDRVVSKAKGRAAVARRGRPVGTATKESTTIRLDKDVLQAFRSGGAGWQTRINAALRDWLRHRP